MPAVKRVGESARSNDARHCPDQPISGDDALVGILEVEERERGCVRRSTARRRHIDARSPRLKFGIVQARMTVAPHASPCSRCSTAALAASLVASRTSQALTFSMIGVSLEPVFSKWSTQSTAGYCLNTLTSAVTCRPVLGSVHCVVMRARSLSCFSSTVRGHEFRNAGDGSPPYVKLNGGLAGTRNASASCEAILAPPNAS